MKVVGEVIVVVRTPGPVVAFLVLELVRHDVSVIVVGSVMVRVSSPYVRVVGVRIVVVFTPVLNVDAVFVQTPE